MLKHPDLTKGRLNRFASELRELLYPKHQPLAGLAVFSAPDRIPYTLAVRGKYRPAKEGEQFGPGWSTHWFRVDYEVPRNWKNEEVLLHFNSSSEGCVWRDGVPLQGLTSYNWGAQEIRSHFTLERKAKGGESGRLYVEAAVNGMFGLGDDGGRSGADGIGHLRHARLVVRDPLVWELLWDFLTIKEMAERLPLDGPHHGPALYAANEIVNTVILGDRETYRRGCDVARKFFAARNGERNHRVSAVGHAHIDTAWLWPVAETKRKCYRTFSTAVLLMEKYPEYLFVCSQAQQLAWIKEHQPVLYRKIKAKAKTGQFIPVGGTWIEPDCNIPNGESLVRQFLFGQRFFKAEFGEYCQEFWNPDVFGYSGALPQIMRGAGINYFLTQKLSWNQFNRPACSTFFWEGIDGSRVLTHFPPTDTYNSVATVEELTRHYTNFKDKERATESYMLFGYGDGGGGPTEEMLERLRRMKDLPGLPSVEIRNPKEFFQRCEADYKTPIVWVGELYFEMHRGTYTTQAANKRDNRRSQELLHDIEFLAAIAQAEGKAIYPHQELARLWELVLLNQFHDIIPGSSIREVYEDSAKDYSTILEDGAKLRSALIGKQFAARRSGKQVLALNTLSWPRREVVSTAPDQFGFVDVPSYGYTVAEPERETDEPVKVKETNRGFELENALVRATLDRNGHLISFFDKRHQRETISGKGNQFALFEDKPACFDAWDVDIYHLEKRRNVGTVRERRIFQEDSLRCSVEYKLELSAKASLVLRVSLDAESPRLDFACEVDWQENEQFLKVEFPFALRSDHATYEIQFGHVRRPTHFNTSWDMAKFEVSAHRWADLSEPGYGVALLNDSKYGYACHGNVLRLSLLRSPKSPDPTADRGTHQFRYALYPHRGGPQEGGVIPAAAAFNQPIQLHSTDTQPECRAWFAINNPAIVIDTVKKAEDSNDLIVRLYESHGGFQAGELRCDLKPVAAVQTDLLERELESLALDRGKIPLQLKPFELLTLKLTLPRTAKRK